MQAAILGGGYAGRALAGYLALHGNELSLYYRTMKNVSELKDAESIELTGVIERFWHLNYVFDDMVEVVLGREVIKVTIPAQAHHSIASELEGTRRDWGLWHGIQISPTIRN